MCILVSRRKGRETKSTLNQLQELKAFIINKKPVNIIWGETRTEDLPLENEKMRGARGSSSERDQRARTEEDPRKYLALGLKKTRVSNSQD